MDGWQLHSLSVVSGCLLTDLFVHMIWGHSMAGGDTFVQLIHSCVSAAADVGVVWRVSINGCVWLVCGRGGACDGGDGSMPHVAVLTAAGACISPVGRTSHTLHEGTRRPDVNVCDLRQSVVDIYLLWFVQRMCRLLGEILRDVHLIYKQTCKRTKSVSAERPTKKELHSCYV